MLVVVVLQIGEPQVADHSIIIPDEVMHVPAEKTRTNVINNDHIPTPSLIVMSPVCKERATNCTMNTINKFLVFYE